MDIQKSKLCIYGTRFNQIWMLIMQIMIIIIINTKLAQCYRHQHKSTMDSAMKETK